MSLYHYITAGFFALFVALDHFGQAHQGPSVPHWRLMGIISTIIYFAAGIYGPLFWDSVLGQHRLIPADTLPFWFQLVGGFLILELGIYLWHRAMHRFDWLWQATHQMHHSAERMDIWGAYYFHPLDSLGWALLSSFCLVFLFGISGEAGFIIALLATIPGMFQHTNIRTPVWLGYIVQRPESHSVHHQRGVHAHNYGDLPIYDILFGTFRNPGEWQAEAGFHEGSTLKVLPILAFRNVDRAQKHS